MNEIFPVFIGENLRIPLPKADNYFMLMRSFPVIISFFICLAAAAQPLRDRTISSGPHAGKKLSEVLASYTVTNHDGNTVRIPAKAISDAITFFDRYSETQRRFKQKVIVNDTEKPGKQFFTNDLEDVESPTIENRRYIVIFDLNLLASAKRLHVINTETGEVLSYEASHGRDTDCGGARLGVACTFISDRESEGTPLGFFSTGEVFNGKHGLSLRMNGLEGSLTGCRRNPDGSFRTCPGNILPTTIIIHSADYVTEGHAGRSHGCVAVSESTMPRIREKLKDGALFYFYHDSIESQRREPVSGLIEAAEQDSDEVSN